MGRPRCFPRREFTSVGYTPGIVDRALPQILIRHQIVESRISRFQRLMNSSMSPMHASDQIRDKATNTSEPMNSFIGSLASANARPRRSEESQAGGGPRPAREGTRGETSHGLRRYSSSSTSHVSLIITLPPSSIRQKTCELFDRIPERVDSLAKRSTWDTAQTPTRSSPRDQR